MLCCFITSSLRPLLRHNYVWKMTNPSKEPNNTHILRFRDHVHGMNRQFDEATQVSNIMLSGVMSKHDFAIFRRYFMDDFVQSELTFAISFHHNHLAVINAIKNVQKETYFLLLKHPYIPAMVSN